MAPGLAALALRAAAQRLFDDLADPALPDLVALLLGATTTGSEEQRAAEQALVRRASQQDLAAVWAEAAHHLEGVAEQVSPIAGQSSQQPFAITFHNGGAANATSGHDPISAGREES